MVRCIEVKKKNSKNLSSLYKHKEWEKSGEPTTRMNVGVGYMK